MCPGGGMDDVGRINFGRPNILENKIPLIAVRFFLTPSNHQKSKLLSALNLGGVLGGKIPNTWTNVWKSERWSDRKVFLINRNRFIRTDYF
ncbi:hypothetical protein CEXT_342781 [Caerostris extrusa]|uniref:Uncharacterized protein n=1 Tax=Caerostris extrusa TaxID=172846 RepID=A0AAV4PF75_CAEEX|nr:hypothetical protein CEXT_342781 [Caerostris extrusa]